MGWFRSQPTSRSLICPICAESTESGRLKIRDVKHRVAGIEDEAERYANRAPDQNQFFCRAAYAIRESSAWAIIDQPSRQLEMLGHIPHVTLNVNCRVCRDNGKPSAFQEFKEFEASGRSLFYGDPSAHNTFTNVCWLITEEEDMHGDYHQALIPIHKACARYKPQSRILFWHMGQPV